MINKNFKLIIVSMILICMCTIAITSNAEATMEQDQETTFVESGSIINTKIVQARGGLNVREYPSADAKFRYLLEDCEVVIILKEVDGWALVAKNNSVSVPIGWASTDYLK